MSGVTGFLKLRWVLSCALALFVGGWGANIELKGRAQADAFCEWTRIGASAGETVHAAETLKEEVTLLVRPDSVAVGFGGVLPRSLHVCNVKTSGGRVSQKGTPVREWAALSTAALALHSRSSGTEIRSP